MPITERGDVFCLICRTSDFGWNLKSVTFVCVFHTMASELSTSLASTRCSRICALKASASKNRRTNQCAKKSDSFPVPVPVTFTQPPRTSGCIRRRWRPGSTIPKHVNMCSIRKRKSNRKNPPIGGFFLVCVWRLVSCCRSLPFYNFRPLKILYSVLSSPL